MALKIKKDNLDQLTLGLNLAVGIVLFTFLGYALDQKLGSQFWVFIGIVLGLFYCGYEVWKLIKQTENQK